MTRRRIRKNRPAPELALRCRRCYIGREDTEKFWRGLCPTCRASIAESKRKATAGRLLERSKTHTEVIDGREYTIMRLPTKYR